MIPVTPSTRSGQGYPINPEDFAGVDCESLGTVDSESVVDGAIGPGKFIQLHPDAEPCPRFHDLEFVIGNLGEGLGIGENHSAKQAVAGDSKPEFRFQVEHVLSPETPLDIFPSRIVIGIPARAG